MQNFKKIFALIFILVTVAFGVMVMVEERDIISLIFQGKLTFENTYDRGISILALIIFVVDVLLILLPGIGFVLLWSDKYDPFKAMVNCGIVVLAKFLISIFAFMLLMMVWEAPADVWNAYMFDKESLAIIPLLVFAVALVCLFVSKVSNLEGTLLRAILATIGSGLAVFGLVFYFILGNGGALIGSSTDPDFFTIFGLVVGIASFGGIIAFSFLPKTRDF